MNASLDVNSLAGLFEKATLSHSRNPLNPALSKSYTLSHDQFLNSEGTKLSLSGTRSFSHSVSYLSYLDLYSRSWTATGSLSHPIIRARQQNLTVRTGFSYKNSYTSQLSEKKSEDRIRSVKLGASYDYTDPWQGVNLFSADVHRGLPIMHASRKGDGFLTRTYGVPEFTKVTADISRNQRFAGLVDPEAIPPLAYLADRINLLWAVSGQYSANQLLSGEQFGLGGTLFGRGFDSSEITGDQGIATKLEMQFTDQPEVPQLKYYQLFAYYDVGMVHNRVRFDEAYQKSLASFGGGVRFGVTDYLSGSLEMAVPATRIVSSHPDNGHEPRGFFSLTGSF